nr:DUF2158 domain-containing protein [uncultured Flavobacterium sp.]
MKVGSKVELISGGPVMTVTSIIGEETNKMAVFAYKQAGHNEGDLICQWYNEKQGKYEDKIFKPTTLKEVE